MVQYDAVLKSVPLFDMIARSELEQLLHCLHAKCKYYKRDQVLLMTGDPISTIGIVLKGRIQVLREDAAGNALLLTELGAGELYAETFVCAELARSPVTVRAASDCTVMAINYRRIVTVCPAACMFHARLIGNMLGLLSRKNLTLNERIELLSKRSTREKVLVYLAHQQELRGASCFTIPFTRQELADFLCVERSALSRELCRMRDEGVLRFTKSEFELLEGHADA